MRSPPTLPPPKKKKFGRCTYNNNVHFEDGRLICSPYLVIIGPSEAMDDNDKIRIANESFARKINIITIISHFQVYVLLEFAES